MRVVVVSPDAVVVYATFGYYCVSAAVVVTLTVIVHTVVGYVVMCSVVVAIPCRSIAVIVAIWC